MLGSKPVYHYLALEPFLVCIIYFFIISFNYRNSFSWPTMAIALLCPRYACVGIVRKSSGSAFRAPVWQSLWVNLFCHVIISLTVPFIDRQLYNIFHPANSIICKLRNVNKASLPGKTLQKRQSP